MSKEQADKNEKLDHIVVLEPTLPAIEELLQTIAKPSIQISRTKSVEEAAGLALGYSPCLVICSISDAQAVNPNVTLLQKIHKGIKKGNLKTMVLARVKNPQLKQLITQLGVTDYNMDPIPVRTLVFKINLHINAIQAIKKREALLNNNTELVFKQDTGKADDSTRTFKHQTAAYARKPALKLPEDIFALSGAVPAKDGKRSIIELEGPTPDSGAWKRMDGKAEERARYRWVPNNSDAAEHKDSATGWVHEGEEPSYNAEKNRWQLSSDKPNLSYLRAGIRQTSKIQVNSTGGLEIADDSEQALQRIRAQEKPNLADAQESPEAIQVPTEASPLHENQAKGLAERHQENNPGAPEETQAGNERKNAARPDAKENPFDPANAKDRAERHKQIKKEIQDIMSSELSAELSDSQAEAIENTLGLAHGEHDKATLAKKDRVARLQTLRAKLKQPNEALRQEQTSQASEEKVFYKTAEQLGSADGAWSFCGNHFVFLTPAHYDAPLDSVRSLMPLWIYSGKEDPSFLTDSQEWRFINIEPRQMKSVQDLPADAQELVKAIKEKIIEQKKTDTKDDENKKDHLEQQTASENNTTAGATEALNTELLNAYEQALVARNPNLAPTLIEHRKRAAAATTARQETKPTANTSNGVTDEPLSEEALMGFMAGVQVLVSDAILKKKHISTRANKLSTLMSKTIKNCQVTILAARPNHAEGTVVGSSRADYEIGKTIEVSSATGEEKKSTLLASIFGTQAQIQIGYIFAQPASQRTHFNNNEQEILNRFAIILGSYWESIPDAAPQSLDIQEKKAA